MKVLYTASDDLNMATLNRKQTSNESRTRTQNYIKSILNIDLRLALFLIIVCVNIVKGSENKTDEIPRRLKLIESFAGRSFSDVYLNGTFRTGNTLWDNLLNKCSVHPSVSCLQSNVYSYLDDNFKFDGDVDIGGGVTFKKNKVDVNKYSKEANIIYITGNKEEGRSIDEDNVIDDDEDESETPLEEVTDALYDKGVKFLVTHDLKLSLPEFFFNGATLKLSPRALTKTGALVHIDLEPKEIGEGRLFFKKIKKYLQKKLVMAAISIILVVKLIALKLIFVLPLILGVTTAKKMFLKLLLFIFPALSHIFKLCSWYHQNYHTTKFHHHHHLITHHHKTPHGPDFHGGPHGSPHGGPIVVRPHAAGPPPSHHSPHSSHGGPSFDHYPQDWELSGPGLGNEYVASGIHRNAIANFKPDVNDMNDINAWGLGLPPGSSNNLAEYASTVLPNVGQPPGYKNMYGNAGRPVGPPNPYNRNKKNTPKDPLQAEKDALIRAASLAARAPPSAVRDEVLRVSALKLNEATRVKTETDLVKQQQEILASMDPETKAADKFYGALLERVEKILVSIGASDLGCRERAVCSLYRDPFRHAPYSNLVSNELSKDASELLPPGDSKQAIQYYVYVNAAREGQESKDCVALYPDCNIDYSKK